MLLLLRVRPSVSLFGDLVVSIHNVTIGNRSTLLLLLLTHLLALHHQILSGDPFIPNARRPSLVLCLILRFIGWINFLNHWVIILLKGATMLILEVRPVIVWLGEILGLPLTTVLVGNLAGSTLIFPSIVTLGQCWVEIGILIGHRLIEYLRLEKDAVIFSQMTFYKLLL